MEEQENLLPDHKLPTAAQQDRLQKRVIEVPLIRAIETKVPTTETKAATQVVEIKVQTTEPVTQTTGQVILTTKPTTRTIELKIQITKPKTQSIKTEPIMSKTQETK
jgi:hypothetical protein